MDFYDWITRKYVEWRGPAIGREKTITEFSKYIGVSQQVMSEWMKRGGSIPRSQKTINKLVVIYGREVYDVLGLEFPGNSDEDVDLSQLSPEMRDELIQARKEFVRRWLEEHGFKRRK